MQFVHSSPGIFNFRGGLFVHSQNSFNTNSPMENYQWGAFRSHMLSSIFPGFPEDGGGSGMTPNYTFQSEGVDIGTPIWRRAQRP
jgi:hypothetical protein